MAAVFVLSFNACSSPDEEETSFAYPENPVERIPSGTLSIPYNSTDSMNPFYCTSVLNCAAVSLVYSSLFRLDSSFSPVRVLSQNESLSGLVLKVYLVPDVCFSDGSPLTSDDVVYSFEKAKASYVYGESLDFIENCYSEDALCVVFDLKYPDDSILNVLTFPIVKKSTADSPSSLPTGSGYYRFYDDGIRLSLQANLKYSGKLPDIGSVLLTDVKGNNTPETLVTTGSLDFCYSDLADANIVGVNCSTTSVYLNNLVYLGVNHENVNLALSSFRQALSYGINRQGIVDSAFMGYARSACVPFNTSWNKYMKSASYSSVSFTGNKELTKSLLSSYGFGENGTPLLLTLVCNESNSFMRSTAGYIADALKEFNINITVTYLSSEDLKNTVSRGEYDLYLGEVKIPSNMSLAEFFAPDGNCKLGMNLDNLTCDEAYFSYLEGNTTIDGFISSFNAEMPFIPIVYRNSRFCYTRNVTSQVVAAESSVFGDINIWTFSENVY